MLRTATIYMSLHQLSEIYHVLAYKGKGALAKDFAKSIINSIIGSDRVVIVNVKRAHFNGGA